MTRKTLAVLASLTAGFFSSVPAAFAEPPSINSSHTPRVVVETSSPRVTVKKGDSVWSIAVQYGLTWQQLASFNHLANANLITPGQTLGLPPPGYAPQRAPVVPIGSPTPPTVSPSPLRVVVAQETPQEPLQSPVVTRSPMSYTPSGVWACIAQHESGGNPATDTGNGFYGAFQFTESSWLGAGGGTYASRPDLASYAEQQIVAQRLQQMQGWGAWPNTSRMCGV